MDLEDFLLKKGLRRPQLCGDGTRPSIQHFRKFMRSENAENELEFPMPSFRRMNLPLAWSRWKSSGRIIPDKETESCWIFNIFYVLTVPDFCSKLISTKTLLPPAATRYDPFRCPQHIWSWQQPSFVNFSTIASADEFLLLTPPDAPQDPGSMRS